MMRRVTNISLLSQLSLGFLGYPLKACQLAGEKEEQVSSVHSPVPYRF